ncbi:Short-chain dehydrogenase/reductase family protein [Mycena venus]|uniref:Short-chain dehydrogenase/reductase family protein n=1 Tax=Mycena venus TaxID=2733690 RepID=A0A8H7DFG0_9AGAR|nr:Short-chain dehydrogenase/reductase family protein [Mycena venus]
MSAPSFTATTTADEVARAFTEQIRGKNVLITGTSLNGIGFETARVLAKDANLVIITGHNSERLKLTEETIKKDVPGANIRPLVLDLSSLAAVRKAATEVNAYAEPLHVLIHNAAAGVGPFALTVDNLEKQMATDHVGPFLLTKLIAPKLLAAHTAAYTPRVVVVSSAGHALCTGIDLSTVAHPDPEKYIQSDAYCKAKCANILFASELSKRAGGKIKAYSLHPGAIFTNLNSSVEAKQGLADFGFLTADFQPTDKLAWKTQPQGAATTVAAAFDPRLEDKPGSYLFDCVAANDQIAPHASDSATAAKLWTITEQIIGETFTF